MKAFLLALVILIFPFSSNAGNNEDFWYCLSVGLLNKEPAILITDVWGDYKINHYNLREADYLKYIKYVTSNQFNQSFNPKCRDYVSIDRAKKHMLRDIEMAKRNNFKILILDWKWKDNAKMQE